MAHLHGSPNHGGIRAEARTRNRTRREHGKKFALPAFRPSRRGPRVAEVGFPSPFATPGLRPRASSTKSTARRVFAFPAGGFGRTGQALSAGRRRRHSLYRSGSLRKPTAIIGACGSPESKPALAFNGAAAPPTKPNSVTSLPIRALLPFPTRDMERPMPGPSPASTPHDSHEGRRPGTRIARERPHEGRHPDHRGTPAPVTPFRSCAMERVGGFAVTFKTTNGVAGNRHIAESASRAPTASRKHGADSGTAAPARLRPSGPRYPRPTFASVFGARPQVPANPRRQTHAPPAGHAVPGIPAMNGGTAGRCGEFRSTCPSRMVSERWKHEFAVKCLRIGSGLAAVIIERNFHNG